MNTIVLRSDDGGAHFIPLEGRPDRRRLPQLWIDPKNPDRRILGVDQGALVTLNGGKTWSSWYNQPTGQFYHVSDRQPLSLPDLRRTAGFGRRRGAQPDRQQGRRHQHD